MNRPFKSKRAAVIATGWVGDTIACTAAATSLYDKGFKVTFFTRWPQLVPILKNDSRFTVRLYWHLKIIRILKPILNWCFDVVIWEPNKWSYQEPFTAEIRRIAGCAPITEYQLFLGPERAMVEASHNSRPVITISRDLYKRAYGRDIDNLISQLQTLGKVEWVGLLPLKNSKHGKTRGLLSDAISIFKSDIFIGPEGGLLWLAAGIGKPCIYFTENIVEVAKQNNIPNLDHILGSKNHYPDKDIYFPLPAYCSNEDAIKITKNAMNTLGVHHGEQ
ncbi:hypothetical protein [Polynucleobacter sp. AP-Nino-20-G2]|uniref:hypothetical protein n=1 Tax=Polynucleobacter sp. AP-Nino-20-G2 TaxID=2576917 RepID=UPI001BFE7C50|nr:hypothetical protein [Polynucleobacter sp. AP-Nino-20-G2]QWE16885.1 hypothetical protein FD960_01270 [Polynucleobacter sp. AP-Nino-20-G2]